MDTPLVEVDNDPGNENLFLQYRNEMADLMTRNLGIVRNREGMESTLARIREIETMFGGINNEYNILKLKNIALTCRLIIQSALIREESRGGHIRDDFPAESSRFRVHIIQQKDYPPVFEPVKD